MAFYLITYRCGHRIREQIYGTNVHGEREAEAARRAARLCPDCWQAERNAAAAAAAETLGLPELVGSENQVRWAMRIRDNAFRALDRQMSKLPTTLTDTQARTRAYRAILASVTSARVWIDHRGAVEYPVPDLIAGLVDDTGKTLLSEITAAELAPVLAAADTDPGVPPDPEPADTTAVARIEPAVPDDGPVLELPKLAHQAHRVWQTIRTGLPEPWHAPTLQPALITALGEASLAGHLLRVAVRDAATATDSAPIGPAEVYRSAHLLLDVYRRHTTDAPTPDHDEDTDSTVDAAPAPADWWVRARLRVIAPARCGRREFIPGEELEMVAFGRAGHPREEDSWWDTDPATALDRGNDLDEVAVIDADNVEVIAVLDRSDS